jgi:hypothetical protein
MRHTRPWIAAAAIAALVVATPGLVPVAEASHPQLYFGAGLRLGGIHLSIGYTPVRHGHPTYYYRTRHRLAYEGYACNEYCTRRSATYYHHERCPVVLHLMHLNRVHPHGLFADHAPVYDGRWSRYDPWDFHRSYGSRHGGSRGYHDGRSRYDGYGRDERHWRQRRHHDDHRYRGYRRHD